MFPKIIDVIAIVGGFAGISILVLFENLNDFPTLPIFIVGSIGQFLFAFYIGYRIHTISHNILNQSNADKLFRFLLLSGTGQGLGIVYLTIYPLLFGMLSIILALGYYLGKQLFIARKIRQPKRSEHQLFSETGKNGLKNDTTTIHRFTHHDRFPARTLLSKDLPQEFKSLKETGNDKKIEYPWSRPECLPYPSLAISSGHRAI